MARKYISPFLLALIIILLQSCRPAYNVINIKDQKDVQEAEGIYYSLPQTVITVDVTVTSREYVKGPYSEYAGKYLGLTNIPTENTSAYSISDVKIGSYVEPDSLHFYMIEARHNFLIKKMPSLMIGLSESGIIQYFNDNSNVEVSQGINEVQTGSLFSSSDSFIQYTGTNLMERVDTIIEKVKQDTSILMKKVFKTTMVEKNSEQRAADAADFIIKINDARVNLLSGIQEVNYSKETMDYMNNKLEELEKEYMELFTGVTKTSVSKYRFFYTPSASSSSMTVPMFRFSSEKGLLDLNDNDGRLVFLEITKQGRTDALSCFMNHQDAKKKSKYKGLYYRIPETARVSLVADTEIKADAIIPVAQLGTVASLPLRKIKTSLWPNTGALRTIEFTR